MARPIKKGLDYFPLDCNMDDDIELFEAECGLEGFAILVKLWGKIYSNSYYTDWNEDHQLLFSKRTSCDKQKLKDVVDVCLRRGIFNRSLYQKYHILTSAGIQKRYIAACSTAKRKTSPFVNEYLLLGGGVKQNLELIYINSEKTLINSEETQVNSEEMEVNSGDKPPKEIKEKYISGNEFPPEFETFYMLYPNRTEKHRTFTNWKSALKHCTTCQLNQAATEYSKTVAGKEKRFIKTSANFLGKEKPYLDYISTAKEKPIRREIIVEEVERV